MTARSNQDGPVSRTWPDGPAGEASSPEGPAAGEALPGGTPAGEALPGGPAAGEASSPEGPAAGEALPGGTPAPRLPYGPGDERGALNLLDAGAVRRGLAAARDGTVLPLAQPIAPGAAPIAGMRTPPVHFMSRDGGDYAAGLPERPGFGFADDSILLACHGATHLDALAHVWQDGVMYGGFSSDQVTSRGAARCGIDKAGPFVCRGLLVDAAADGPLAPGTPVGVDVLRAALDGVDPQPGDALLVRTGWPAAWRADRSIGTETWPGLDTDCAEWIVESGFALVGADNVGVEVCPSTDPACGSPLHIALIRDHGIYFLELLDLDPLAAALAAADRREFLLVVAPLPITRAVGSPVAPVAVL